MQGKQYSLELDLAGFNAKTGKICFDYYLNNSYLPTLEEYCKKNGFDFEEIKELKYREIEKLINNKQKVMAIPKQTPYVVKKEEAENLIQSATDRKKMREIEESAEDFRRNNLNINGNEEIIDL